MLKRQKSTQRVQISAKSRILWLLPKNMRVHVGEAGVATCFLPLLEVTEIQNNSTYQ